MDYGMRSQKHAMMIMETGQESLVKTKSKGGPYKIACSRVTVARLSFYSQNIFFK